jgi:hypothetical protein
VQDIFPYLEMGCTHEQIRVVMPLLSREEIQAVEQYVHDHRETVLATARQIEERNASRRNSPEVDEVLRQARVERKARMELLRQKRPEERNGDSDSC